jgi:hypothetical protein
VAYRNIYYGFSANVVYLGSMGNGEKTYMFFLTTDPFLLCKRERFAKSKRGYNCAVQKFPLLHKELSGAFSRPQGVAAGVIKKA